MKLKPYSEVFFVHYQCGDLNHDEVPITSLCIYAKGNMELFGNSDESQNIEAYCNKVMQLCDEGLIPVHWNQNRDSYGITHILSRYKKLTGGTIQIEYRDCIDLSDFLWNKYGNDYIEHPRLDKLAELNSFRGHRKNEYGNRTFPENRLSLLTKIYAGELRGTLKTRINTPPVPTNERQEKKEIHILPEKSIELIYNALAPHFQGYETRLRRLLEGEPIEEPLNWSKNANQLTHVFWGAKRKGWISCANVQTCEWILKNFRYKNGKTFDKNSVTKDLNTQETRCKKPLLNTNF